jgi:ATP-binding cassette subfamily B protein
MDCGPACLKSLLEGFSIPVSYGRLREACQTEVDGTSIDTMEDVAAQLGLAAEQVMVPADHVLLAESKLLPAIIVVRLPNGITHFVLAWRRHGPVLQIMDPATGRRWSSCAQFLAELYIHEMTILATGWIEWAKSDEFLRPLYRRLTNLGITGSVAKKLIETSVICEGWRRIAALDAATRMTDSLARSGGFRRGRHLARLLQHLVSDDYKNNAVDDLEIPARYWSVRCAAAAADGAEQLVVTGSVLVHVRGWREAEQAVAVNGLCDSGAPSPLPPELIAALEENRRGASSELLRLLLADGLLAPVAIITALFIAASAVVIEALLFRGLLDIAAELRLSGQRVGALAALLMFLLAVLLLELPIANGLLRFGRRLDCRLRAALLEKIPRLSDRYFHSRLTSDMAERSHSIERIRLLPELGGQLIRTSFQVLLTAAGIAWLEPAAAAVALLSALIAIAVPLGAQPVLIERDLRLRTHGGALSLFYMDALQGAVAIRAHRAERFLRREHQKLLAEWARSAFRVQRVVVSIEGVQFFLGFGLAAWLLLDRVSHGGDIGTVLLLVYWALSLPVLGQEIVLLARQYPAERNIALRVVEPLGTPEEHATAEPKSPEPPPGEQQGPDMALVASRQGVSVNMEGVTVRAGGHLVLEGIDLAIEPGSHVAIVGSSGAGKSSLVGILLGWQHASAGCVLVDGRRLDSRALERLRLDTAWVDPAVQLWNRSLIDNLAYGSPAAAMLPLDLLLKSADLISVLEKLPHGLQTQLGEGGGLMSGGEGQRVRVGRAMVRRGARLVILDEPFRSLDRDQRREMLRRARELWSNATILCITHDIGETANFDRVLVMRGGRVVEDGTPAALAVRSGSSYRAMLEADQAVMAGLWSSARWRRLQLKAGELLEETQIDAR